ncbi:unnamed protein product [Paramecium pentaurelia]|uniref:Uncharacterized protein n=1 Tax=Paramecium pentaurelia TaxID=43138 RepID=A0A8S1TK63_9CILI|nr:unnamed protein product [Paramecium pentaurelia]
MSYVEVQMGFGDIKRAKQSVAVGILILVFQDGFINYLQQKEERINKQMKQKMY